MSLPPAERLPLGVKLGNGLGSVAFGVKDNGFSVFLLIFYNQVIGLDAGIVGLVLLLALLLDALIDPLVGYWSDHTRSRWGQRHPWLYGAILPMTLFWLLVWHPPEPAGFATYAWLLVTAFLLRASVSCYEIPALSVGPALTSDYVERTSLTRWRFLFGWTGGLAILILAFGFFFVPSADYPVATTNRDGFDAYALTGAAMILFATFFSALSTHRRIASADRTSAPTHLPLRENIQRLRAIVSNPAFLILLLSSLCAFINQGMSFSITTYTLTYFWELPRAGFVAYSMTLFVGVVMAFLIAGALQHRMEKRTLAICAGCFSITVAVLPYVLRFAGLFPANNAPLLIPILFTLVTLSNGASVLTMMMGQSMAADVIEEAQARSGERTEGIFFSGYFFTQKCATGVGIFLTGTILSLAGFPDNAVPGQVAQPVLDQLALFYICVLTLFALISITAISRFPITRADHEARVAALGGARGGD
jgi:GPH family glycoside/pentoside/hexuronide:cation symporter